MPGEDPNTMTREKEDGLPKYQTKAEKPIFENVEVEQSDCRSHNGATPLNTAPDATSERQRRQKPAGQNSNLAQTTIFGLPIRVNATGSFPAIGSTLGPYFCLGKLGKGTFSSIHKCVNLQYFHNDGDVKKNKRRIAAAKVELSDFQQSGVLESEATVLDFLYRSLPNGTVPVYMGHYKCGNYAAIVMEYLPGDDMNQLREQAMLGSQSRRIALRDAVYLTADVLLHLLEKMNKVGMVHRDVKPSNCVRRSKTGRDFCLVDFGLSKSIVVPEDSDYADKTHLWQGDWLKPHHYAGKGAYRIERKKADFRGTSMYASLRVHQGKDYCPRDDAWSLMYVFLDLVTGGLPWMSYAANRDRASCQALKERVHGERMSSEGEIYDDETELLLKGDLYHIATFRRERHKEAGGDVSNMHVPAPLKMSQDKVLVESLRKVFQHLSRLKFFDMPDYRMIQRCIKGFLPHMDRVPADPIPRSILWVKPPDSPDLKRRSSGYPEWELLDSDDPLLAADFEDAQTELESEPKERIDSTGQLPVEVQFRLAQMKHNAESGTSQPWQALNDWMQVVSPLLYKDWNARKYEDGGHRTSTDGFRRARYLELLEACLACAKKHDNFRSKEFFYQAPEKEGDPLHAKKKRKVTVHSVSETSKRNPMVFVSKALFGLENAITAERAKKPPPPMRISFS